MRIGTMAWADVRISKVCIRVQHVDGDGRGTGRESDVIMIDTGTGYRCITPHP